MKTIQPYNRLEPCYIPTTHMYIDYNGDAMLCCNFRNDIKNHEKFIMGNLKYNTLSEIRNSKKYLKYMKLLSKYGKKLYPCNTCRMGV